MKSSGVYVPGWPHVLGFDAAGVVEAVGSAVADRRIGQRVLFCANNTLGLAYGAFQEKAKVWSASTILVRLRIPSSRQS